MLFTIIEVLKNIIKNNGSQAFIISILFFLFVRIVSNTSSLLFSPTLTGYNNLIREGFRPNNKKKYTPDNPGIFHCGDIMYDNSLYFSKISDDKSKILEQYNLVPEKFILAF